ncbi:MAG: VanZ family protein [Acidobacteriota bacterium]
MKLHLTHPIRLFSTPARAWTAVGVYTALLYSTLDLVLQAYLWVFERLGEASVAGILNGIYAAAGLALLVLLRPRRLGAYATLILIAAGLVVFFQQLQQPANRLHFLQYGPLTLLVFDALRFHCRDRYHYVWTLLLVTCIGLGDETLQIFAGRRFDSYDLLLNSMAALFVLALIGFVVEPEGFRAKTPGSQT